MARTRYALLPPRVGDDLDPVDVGRLSDGDDLARAELTGDAMGHEVADLDIIESRLSAGVLTGAVLDRLLLTDVLIEGCDLSGAVLEEAALTRVEFRDCRLSGTVLTDSRLRDVRFANCRLDGASFRMARTEHLEFEDVNLRAADFYAAKLTAARFFGCDLSEAEFSQADLHNARLHGSTLQDLKGAGSLTGAVIDPGQVYALAPQLLRALSIAVDEKRDAEG